MTPRGSVVIPAHDEGARIGATLTQLLADAGPGEWEVVVVCNGCTDDTASQARAVEGVRVVELAAASKLQALRAGDDAATAFPRLYLDADVLLSTATARQLAEATTTPAPVVAGARARLDLAEASRPARWHATFHHDLPVFASGIIGAGVYALSAAGRARFGEWPDVLADDQFVFRLFAADERRLVPGHTVVRPPARLSDVVRRGVRVRRGNRQLAAGAAGGQVTTPPAAGLGAALRTSLSRPTSWSAAATWLAVQTVIRALDASGRAVGDWPGSPPGQ